MINQILEILNKEESDSILQSFDCDCLIFDFEDCQTKLQKKGTNKDQQILFVLSIIFQDITFLNE